MRYAVGAFSGFVITLFATLVYFAFGDGTVSPVNKSHYDIFKDYVSPMVAGFAGATAGAICAYALSVIQRTRQDLEQSAEVFVFSVYAVFAMIEDVSNTIEKIVRPHESQPARFLLIPHIGYTLRPYELDIDKRVFGLFVRLRAVDGNQKLFLAEGQYKNLIHQISARRDLMSEYWNFRNTTPIKDNLTTLSELTIAVGATRILNIYVASETFIESLISTRTALLDLANYLESLGRKHFTGKGVSVFFPKFKDLPGLNPPLIKSIEDLKSIIGTRQLYPIRISESDWSVPGRLTGRPFY